MKAAPWSWV